MADETPKPAPSRYNLRATKSRRSRSASPAPSSLLPPRKKQRTSKTTTAQPKSRPETALQSLPKAEIPKLESPKAEVPQAELAKAPILASLEAKESEVKATDDQRVVVEPPASVRQTPGNGTPTCVWASPMSDGMRPIRAFEAAAAVANQTLNVVEEEAEEKKAKDEQTIIESTDITESQGEQEEQETLPKHVESSAIPPVIAETQEEHFQIPGLGNLPHPTDKTSKSPEGPIPRAEDAATTAELIIPSIEIEEPLSAASRGSINGVRLPKSVLDAVPRIRNMVREATSPLGEPRDNDEGFSGQELSRDGVGEELREDDAGLSEEGADSLFDDDGQDESYEESREEHEVYEEKGGDVRAQSFEDQVDENIELGGEEYAEMRQGDEGDDEDEEIQKAAEEQLLKALRREEAKAEESGNKQGSSVSQRGGGENLFISRILEAGDGKGERWTCEMCKNGNNKNEDEVCTFCMSDRPKGGEKGAGEGLWDQAKYAQYIS